MDQQSTTASPANGASSAHELFALTDEQILEIEPEQEASGVAVEQPLLAVPARSADTTNAPSAAQPNGSPASSQLIENTQQSTHSGVPVLPEPPAWLAAQMKDPWSGEEAKELWNGVLQARSEAAAYRAAFATPEDARALKELYPGGVNEARAAASRARLLEEIDRSFFGATGATPEQTSAARAQLAGMMLREDPAAFREMVFAGLRALEEAEKGSGTSTSASNLPRLAQAFAANRPDASGAGATLASPAADGGPNSRGGASPAPTMANGPLAANAASGASSLVEAQLYPERSRGNAAPQLGTVTASEAHVAAYATFEKTANEDLERSVGAAIAHTILQALPNLGKDDGKATVGARNIVPLQERLGAAVRQDVEAALKGDSQLGEQIAQILSARRFDNETRAQVVRLIDDRARQLVPSAARRVINDWTQATLAAHRGKAASSDAVSTRTEVLPANTEAGRDTLPASPAQRTLPSQNRTLAGSARSDSRRVDYRKLSDEQILEL